MDRRALIQVAGPSAGNKNQPFDSHTAFEQATAGVNHGRSNITGCSTKVNASRLIAVGRFESSRSLHERSFLQLWYEHGMTVWCYSHIVARCRNRGATMTVLIVGTILTSAICFWMASILGLVWIASDLFWVAVSLFLFKATFGSGTRPSSPEQGGGGGKGRPVRSPSRNRDRMTELVGVR